MEPPTPKLGNPQEHIYTTDVRTWEKLKAYARENRKAPTPAEAALWQLLRGKQTGAKFRRQHAIERFIVDFVCLSAWLIIEVDGEYHADAEQAEYDGGRTHRLQELGFQVLRFSNEEVLHHPNYVTQLISNHLTRPFPHQEAPGSPSPQGEGAGG